MRLYIRSCVFLVGVGILDVSARHSREGTITSASERPSFGFAVTRGRGEPCAPQALSRDFCRRNAGMALSNRRVLGRIRMSENAPKAAGRRRHLAIAQNRNKSKKNLTIQFTCLLTCHPLRDRPTMVPGLEMVGSQHLSGTRSAFLRSTVVGTSFVGPVRFGGIAILWVVGCGAVRERFFRTRRKASALGARKSWSGVMRLWSSTIRSTPACKSSLCSCSAAPLPAHDAPHPASTLPCSTRGLRLAMHR